MIYIGFGSLTGQIQYINALIESPNKKEITIDSNSLITNGEISTLDTSMNFIRLHEALLDSNYYYKIRLNNTNAGTYRFLYKENNTGKNFGFNISNDSIFFNIDDSVSFATTYGNQDSLNVIKCVTDFQYIYDSVVLFSNTDTSIHSNLDFILNVLSSNNRVFMSYGYQTTCNVIPPEPPLAAKYFITLQSKLMDSYFIIPDDNILGFSYKEKYEVSNNPITYEIYNKYNRKIALKKNPATFLSKYGMNDISINLSTLKDEAMPADIYVLKVIGPNKGNEYFIKFKLLNSL